VPNDRLAELIWGQDRPQNVAGSLQTFISMLRRSLTPDRHRARRLVVTETEAYRFATDLADLDLDAFDRLLERSAREPTGLARASLERALALVRGDVLEDEPYATWALDLRRTYHGRIVGARLDAADAALAEHDLMSALAHAEAATKLDQFSERGFRIQMLALHALGRSQEALSRYREFRTRLIEDLGLEPAPETRALESAVIRQEDVRSLLPRPIRNTPARSGGSGRVRLLGREAEIDTIIGAVDHALERGVALIQIEAEPGLGKSRMLDEVLRRLEGVRVGRGECSPLERHLAYAPLATALRMALAGAAPDIRALPALGRILPELTLTSPSPQFEDVEVLEALVALVGKHAPLVLLLDDLHWADDRTLAAVGYLRRRGADLAAVVVTTAPPAEMSSGSYLNLRPDTVLRLEPLSRDDLEPLGMPDLHKATGGNPLFVTETLAHDQQAERAQTLTDALVAQCRSEGAWAHRVLVAASVLDQPFELDVIAQLLGVDTGEMVEVLEGLCEKRILRVDGLRFRFRYDLVRQALVSSISPARHRLIEQQLDRLILDPSPIPISRTTGSQAAG